MAGRDDMRFRRSSGFVLFAALLLVAACSRAPRDPVLECVNGAAKAAEARDADGLEAD